MNKSENIDLLATALSKCQGEMEPAIKDSLNPHFKSRYADLNSVWAACRGPLSKHGLSVVQTIDMINDKMILITTLIHSSGQWISSIMPVVCAKQDAQGIGSGLSYARRYSLSAICGISQDDDDGNAAMPQEKNGKEKPKENKDDSVIDEKKVQQLHSIIETCDKEYVQKLWSYLSSMQIQDLSQLPNSMFNKILNAVVQNAELNNKK